MRARLTWHPRRIIGWKTNYCHCLVLQSTVCSLDNICLTTPAQRRQVQRRGKEHGHCHVIVISYIYSNILGEKGKAVVMLDDLFLHLLRNMNEQSIFYISDKNCWFAISLFVFVRIQRMMHSNSEGQFTAVTPIMIIFVVTKYDIYCSNKM